MSIVRELEKHKSCVQMNTMIYPANPLLEKSDFKDISSFTFPNPTKLAKYRVDEGIRIHHMLVPQARKPPSLT